MGVSSIDMPGTSPIRSSHHLRWILDPHRVIRRWVSLVKSIQSMPRSLGPRWAGGSQILGISHIKTISAFAARPAVAGFQLQPTASVQVDPPPPLMTKTSKKGLPEEERFSRRCCCPTPAAAPCRHRRLSASSLAGPATAPSNLEKGPLMTSRRDGPGLVFHRAGSHPQQFPRLLPTIPESPSNNGVCQMRIFFPFPSRPFHSLPFSLPPPSRTSSALHGDWG